METKLEFSMKKNCERRIVFCYLLQLPQNDELFGVYTMNGRQREQDCVYRSGQRTSNNHLKPYMVGKKSAFNFELQLFLFSIKGAQDYLIPKIII